MSDRRLEDISGSDLLVAIELGKTVFQRLETTSSDSWPDETSTSLSRLALVLILGASSWEPTNCMGYEISNLVTQKKRKRGYHVKHEPIKLTSVQGILGLHWTGYISSPGCLRTCPRNSQSLFHRRLRMAVAVRSFELERKSPVC